MTRRPLGSAGARVAPHAQKGGGASPRGASAEPETPAAGGFMASTERGAERGCSFLCACVSSFVRGMSRTGVSPVTGRVTIMGVNDN